MLGRRQFFAALALLLIATALVGCDTTRDKNQRAKLFADRALATREKVVVKKKFAPIEVEQVQKVGSGKTALIVVRLKNTDTRTWAALPINVSAGGELLNRGPDIPYFANHVPAIGAGATAVWILRTGKSIPGGSLDARVGAPDPTISDGKTIPDLRAVNIDPNAGGVLGLVENHSGTPQYSVEIYLTARKGNRYTAAALGRVVKLSGRGKEAFNLDPVGKLGKAEPQVTLGPAVLVPESGG